MQEKIVAVLNEMSEYLSIAQMKKLQEVIIKTFAENEAVKTNISNKDFLEMFLAAKRVEGCSDRTLQYYRVTVAHMFTQIDTEVRKITMEEIRSYLANYQKRNDCSNVTIDNVRRNISSFFFILWSEIGTQQDYEAEYGNKPLGEFIREIVGLDMAAAKAAFADYLDETNLDSRQIYFVNQIIEFIVHNGMMKDLSVLQETPFTDQGSIVEVFTDLTVWRGIMRVIEQVNANALAA